MAEKKPPKTVVIPAPSWMVSFGDTVALMLAFFVMLYAISSVDPSTVSRLIAAVVTDDTDINPRKPTPNSNYSIESTNFYRGREIPYLAELLETKFLNVPALETLEMGHDNNEIVVVIPNDVFVSDLDANISEQGKDFLYQLGLVLSTVGNTISIEGFSPPQSLSPESQASFDNSWEIRLLRATNIAQQMKRNGLLASNRILGWAHAQHDQNTTESISQSRVTANNGDTRVALRINQNASGQ